jgi:hypothetical protein
MERQKKENEHDFYMYINLTFKCQFANLMVTDQKANKKEWHIFISLCCLLDKSITNASLSA